jgi:hypothetical protein
MAKDRELLKNLSRLLDQEDKAQAFPLPSEEVFKRGVIISFQARGTFDTTLQVALQEWFAAGGSDLVWNGFRQWLEARKGELATQISAAKKTLQEEWSAGAQEAQPTVR